MKYFIFGFVLLCLVGSSPTTSNDEAQIVGGEEIDITEAPYQVSLQREEKHHCGGSILSKDVIITAAHCILWRKPSEFKVRAGSSSVSKGGVLVGVRNMTWNSDFLPEKLGNDVGIVWLSELLVFSDAVGPLNLFDVGEEIKDGERVAVTGWGRLQEGKPDKPDKLQRIYVHTINYETCREAYKYELDVTPTMMCAGEKEGGKNACKGDSGGPLIYNGKLAGIVSWSKGCGRPDYPGVYAKVSALRGWIDEKTGFLKSSVIN